MSMHGSGAPASLSGGWDEHQDVPRRTTSAPGMAGTTGVDHMVADPSQRSINRPLAPPRQDMMEFPPVKRQDQDKAHVTSIIPTAEKLHLSRDPTKIYPLRISPSDPTRRLTEVMARSVKSPLPASTRQHQIKRLYEKRLYDICEGAERDWAHAIEGHQAAHFEDKHDYLKHQSGSSDSVSAKRQAYRQYQSSMCPSYVPTLGSRQWHGSGPARAQTEAAAL